MRRGDLRWLSSALPLFTALLALPAHAALGETEAVQIALRQNPSVLQARSELAAAQARLEGASLLTPWNPQFSASVGTRRRDGSDLLELGLALSQPIEVGGQRGRRIEAAQALKVAAASRLAMRQLEIAALTRNAFGHVLASRAALQLAEEALALALNAEDATGKRYRAGDASLVELNTARIDSGRAATQKAIAEREHQEALGRLRLLLGITAGESLEVTGSLEPEDGWMPPGLHELLERVVDRPDLVAARAEVDAARAERTLAARSAIPTPSIGAAYGTEEEDQIVQGTLAIDLPVFNRNQGERGAAGARVTQAETALAALERQAEQEVRMAAAQYATARAAASAWAGSAGSAADENLRLASEGYAAGKLDLFQVLLIRRDALQARRERIEALEALHQAKVELMRAAGISG